MDKYDFQELLKAYGFAYYQGGGIYHRGSGGKVLGKYVSGTGRTIRKVMSNNDKLSTLCLIHNIETGPY